MKRISRLIILALLVNVYSLHGQSNYYISSVHGSVNGDGSAEKPWNSLEQINAYNLSQGDSEFFESYDDSECDGCTWGEIEICYNCSDA